VIKVKNFKFLLACLFVLCTLTSYSQEEFTLKQQRDSALIGQTIDIVFSYPIESNSFSFPNIADSLAKNDLEVLEISKTDTLNQTVSQFFKVTAWDSGNYSLSTLMILTSDSTLIPVQGVLNLRFDRVSVDTAEAIKPIYDPNKIPYTFKEVFPYLLIAVGVLLLALMVYYLVKKAKNKDVPVKVEKIIPPQVIALENLQQLESDALWKEEKYKEFYTRLKDILRVYIEAQFALPAMESTSEELKQAFKSIPKSKDFKDDLSHMLMRADMSKFAKAPSTEHENVKDLSFVKNFVMNTIKDENNSDESV
jgi:hypothetical protein